MLLLTSLLKCVTQLVSLAIIRSTNETHNNKIIKEHIIIK